MTQSENNNAAAMPTGGDRTPSENNNAAAMPTIGGVRTPSSENNAGESGPPMSYASNPNQNATGERGHPIRYGPASSTRHGPLTVSAGRGPPTASGCHAAGFLKYCYPGDTREASGAFLDLMDLRISICDKTVCSLCHEHVYVGFKADGETTTPLVSCSNDECPNCIVQSDGTVKKQASKHNK